MNNTILIIEDDVIFSTLLENKFKADYTIIIKENGLEAMQWLQEGNVPDLIIADLNMPFMNGYELIGKLKSDPVYSKIPLVIVSGEDRMLIKNRCYKAGANKFFKKPVPLPELALTVKELVERSKVNIH